MNVSVPTFVSIACLPFSGSTLLSILLGTHPDIATVAEMHGPDRDKLDIDQYQCSCGRLIKRCSFWQAVQQNMREQGFELDVTNFDTRFGDRSSLGRLQWGPLGSSIVESVRDFVVQAWPGHKVELERLVARNEAFVKAVLEITGKSVFVDTSKNPRRLKHLAKFSSFDVRAIFLIRDARGSVVSQMRHMGDRDTRRAARSWTRGNLGMERTLKLLPDHKQTMLKYEDFCRDPQASLQALYRFVSVDPSIPLPDLDTLPERHVIGNSIRLRSISQIKLDERWKSVLNQEQLNTINQITGRQSKVYGY